MENAKDVGWTYRLIETEDPEERLEDAAMWKALWDASDGQITLTKSQDATFGAVGSLLRHQCSLRYWDDPAFLNNCGREFQALTLDGAIAAVGELHTRGKDAFVKAGLDKYFAQPVKRGETLPEALDALIFTFADSHIPLMVQELVDFTFEHRFFVINREIVTWSPAAYTLTPIDYPLQFGKAWRKQADKEPMSWSGVPTMLSLAQRIAKEMAEPNATVDIGMIGDTPAVVEFNPLRIGQVGLFACDVRALANAALRDYPTTPTHKGE